MILKRKLLGGLITTVSSSSIDLSLALILMLNRSVCNLGLGLMNVRFFKHKSER